MSRPRAKSLQDKLFKRKSSQENGLLSVHSEGSKDKKEKTKFVVKQVTSTGIAEDRVLLITEDGIFILDSFGESQLAFYPLEKIKRWYTHNDDVYFVHTVESAEDGELKMTTQKQAEKVHEAMNQVIKHRMKSTEKKKGGSFIK